MNYWQLWARGISVIPVPAPSAHHDGKRPIIAWKAYQARLPARAEMRRWFAGPTNYAVVTGDVSGIVVVDVDDRRALPWLRWNLEPTPWVVRTSKGYHCYYRCPMQPMGNRARVSGMKLDVRGDGGYVIGPGSRHSSGLIYRAVGDWTVPRDWLPVFNADVLAKPERAPEAIPIRAEGDVIGRARRYLARVPATAVGCGSDAATFEAACRLVRGFGVTPDDAVALLQEWAPDFDAWWLRLKVEGALRYGTEPPGGKL